jgi:hypothetical protein
MIALVLVLAATSIAHADDPTRARELFEQADAASSAGRFAAARDLLRESLALHRHPAAAFNLGVALRGTGEFIASVAIFEELLGGGYGELPEERRAQVEALVAEVRAEIAELTIEACGAASIAIRVDGEIAGTATRCEPIVVPVDPGAHVIVLEAEHAEPVERRISVARAERATVRGRVVVRMPVTAPPPDEPSVAESPWLWLGIGTAVAAGGAVALFFLLNQTNPHVTDPVFGEIVTLR